MNMKELVTNNDGKLSHTKVWSNIAYGTATIVFIYQAYNQTLTADIWLIYLGVVGAHSAVSKAITAKYGSSTTEIKE